MAVKKLTRKQIEEGLTSMPVSHILGARESKALTPKQRAFAMNVAKGSSKAQAYRESYKPNATQGFYQQCLAASTVSGHWHSLRNEGKSQTCIMDGAGQVYAKKESAEKDLGGLGTDKLSVF